MDPWLEITLSGFLGGLLALERRAFLQAMFSRPLVAGTGMGLLLGDVSAGLAVGTVLELFHLGSANLGAALADNETLAAAGTTAAAAALGRGAGGSTAAIWSAAIIALVWLGPAGRMCERALERYSEHLAEKALLSAEEGDLTTAIHQNLWGMWPHFVVFGLFTAACAQAGYAVSHYWELLPFWAARGLAWAYPAMTSVAAAVAVRGSHSRRAAAYACAAAGAVMLIGAVRGLFQGHP